MPIILPESAPADAPRQRSRARERLTAPLGSSGLRLKHLAVLFILFLVVVSDLFVDNALSAVRGATKMRNPTTQGVMLQAAALVGGFALATHLMEMGAL